MKGEDWRKYWRASTQRLEDAQVLIRFERNHAAVYLAGYVVECALKALLIHSTPMSRRRELVDEKLRGAKAHSLEALHEALKNRGVRIPRDLTRSFARVVGWSTDQRYEVGRMKTELAVSFVKAVELIHAWVGRNVDG